MKPYDYKRRLGRLAWQVLQHFHRQRPLTSQHAGVHQAAGGDHIHMKMAIHVLHRETQRTFMDVLKGC